MCKPISKTSLIIQAILLKGSLEIVEIKEPSAPANPVTKLGSISNSGCLCFVVYCLKLSVCLITKVWPPTFTFISTGSNKVKK